MTQDWSCIITDSNFKPKSDKVYLVLMHVNLQPAHLALLYNNAIYSISHKRVDLGSQFEKLEIIIRRKSIPCLFIQLENLANVEHVSSVLESVFKPFKPLSANGETCLNPIKLSFEMLYGFKIAAQLVFDILHLFERKELISKIASLNIPEGDFVLMSYSVEDVDSQIRKLLNKEN